MRMFQEDELRALCEVLGDTHQGLTNSEIDQIFQRLRIEDLYANSRYSRDFIVTIISKKDRLFETLRRLQSQTTSSRQVIEFIQAAMSPVRYVNNKQQFITTRERLNIVLSFAGMQITEEGKISATLAVSTLDEAQRRANKFRGELDARDVHYDLLVYCRAELFQENYFHAVFEATKSVAEKIRMKTGLDADGAELVDRAFGFKDHPPILAFNSLRTQTERSEHLGLMTILKGMFGTFRNVTAHAPKFKWEINERDALDLFSLASFLHRRIDGAVPLRSQS